MGMISGPYTDAVVKMLMNEDRRFFDGDVIKNAAGKIGLLYEGGVWIADPVVREVSPKEFGAESAALIRLPEPYGDTFRFTEGDGNIFIPEYKPAEKAFLRQCGYDPVFPGKAAGQLKEAKGSEKHKLFPFSCRIGVLDEMAAAEVLRILTHLYD